MFPRLYGPVDLEPGRLNVIGPATFSTGGVVSNTGLAMHRLGVAVRLVGKVGDDLFGRVVRDAYRELRPSLADGLTLTPAHATSYTLVINPPHRDRAYLHCPGANETFSAADVRDEHLADARLFHFGYPPLMPRMYAADGAELRDLFTHARRAGLITALDMCVPDPASEAGSADWPAVLQTALPAVDVFAPSIDELLFMIDRARFDELLAGHSLSGVLDRASLRELSDRLIGMGSAIVALKLGDHGLYLRTTADPARLGPICERLALDASAWTDCEILAPCFRVDEIVGTTGSGDATIGGLLTAILRGHSATEAVTVATAVGACSVESIDPTTGIPSWDDLMRRVAGGWRRCDIQIDLGSARSDRDASGNMMLR